MIDLAGIAFTYFMACFVVMAASAIMLVTSTLLGRTAPPWSDRLMICNSVDRWCTAFFTAAVLAAVMPILMLPLMIAIIVLAVASLTHTNKEEVP